MAPVSLDILWILENVTLKRRRPKREAQIAPVLTNVGIGHMISSEDVVPACTLEVFNPAKCVP